MMYCFLASYSLSSFLNLDSHYINFFPLWKNTMIPHERSSGEISCAILTRCSLENRAYPEANDLQYGFLAIKKDLIQEVLSWLSKINLLDFDIFVNVIDLETARGTLQITFLHLNIFFWPVLLFLVVITQKSDLLLSTVITCWL